MLDVEFVSSHGVIWAQLPNTSTEDERLLPSFRYLLAWNMFLGMRSYVPPSIELYMLETALLNKVQRAV
jgi:hypothetical protein